MQLPPRGARQPRQNEEEEEEEAAAVRIKDISADSLSARLKCGIAFFAG